MRKVILRSFQSPGDILMLTAAVRDLHAATPKTFLTDVRTSTPQLWENNRLITPLDDNSSGVQIVDMHYPLIHQSNQRPYHFLHGYAQFLEEQLGIRIPVTQFRGDVYLSDQERGSAPSMWGVTAPYWIVMAGGKFDFTAKWWNPTSYQTVVDAFQGKLHFVQCGLKEHWHPPLSGVTNLVGKLDIRGFLQLVYHADGILCPVTFAMHAAAAVPTAPGKPSRRACVVVAGGREPPHWEAYPEHRYLSTNGALSCCQSGGCWKSRCQKVGDGDLKDRRGLCEQPVQVNESLAIPRCMEMIRPEDVVNAIDLYYRGGALKYTETNRSRTAPRRSPPVAQGMQARRILIQFRHGLGDAVQLTAVLKHLRRLHPGWRVDVASLRGKHSCYSSLADNVYVLDEDRLDHTQFDQVYPLDWHEADQDYPRWPSTKVTRCLLEIFRIAPSEDLCRYSIEIPEAARRSASRYLAEVTAQPPDANGKFRAVLIHYQGNTSQSKKNLPHAAIQLVCEDVIREGFTPVILDWDQRSPLVNQETIFNPASSHPLWMGQNTGDAAVIAALVESSALMIGIDSGPLHVAGATGTPAIGVWTAHHPVRYFDLADNVIHLVPQNHADRAPGPRSLKYFEDHYRHHVYRDLATELRSYVLAQITREDEPEVRSKLSNREFLKKLSATSYDEQYYQEHRDAGLDYLAYGSWQAEYCRWLTDTLGLSGKHLLDAGCACGSIVRGFAEAGVVTDGVDLNEYMILQGRAQWPELAKRLHICDAVNLHLFEDEQFDVVHSAQVAEHWKPELVPCILRELQRVTKPRGLFVCFLDTLELMDRQGRRAEEEDPTHICIKPLSWWQQHLTQNGWQVCSGEFRQILQKHPLSYLRKYDWDWFIARKV